MKTVLFPPFLRNDLDELMERIEHPALRLCNELAVYGAADTALGDIVELRKVLYRAVQGDVILQCLGHRFHFLHGAEVVVHLVLVIAKRF